MIRLNRCLVPLSNLRYNITSRQFSELKLRPSFSLNSTLKPKEVVEHLDKYIIGQKEAKKAVAISLRNRWRRHLLSDEIRDEVVPKNILMIGPTGCGKTEIARRIAKLSQAPFIKVEATKFTEVGFHGKDVEQIIKDLLDNGIAMTRKKIIEQIKAEVDLSVEDRILEALVGENADNSHSETFRKLLKDGDIDDRMIEVVIPVRSDDKGPFTIDMNSFGTGDMFKNKSGGFSVSGIGSKKAEKKKLSIKNARSVIEEIETERLLEEHDIIKEAIQSVEDNGIVFIDEIDKLVNNSDYRGADASAEGVQRDLLPIIEGTVISTKHGDVKTDFILFVCSGAFHSSKPSDLLAELQGRLPVRVTLQGLTESDLYRILTEPVTNLLYQQCQMFKAEDVDLSFTDGAIKEIARIAFEINKSTQNIGARRLHTVIERVCEEMSFNASEKKNESIVITDEYVKSRIGDLLMKSDMRKYIL
jgi:ATP-dependent HslUV protease ATP-binding subunit HslU